MLVLLLLFKIGRYFCDDLNYCFVSGTGLFLQMIRCSLARIFPRKYVRSHFRHPDSTRSNGNWSKNDARLKERHKSTLYYLGACTVLVAGASYAAVPMYRIFCQVTDLQIYPSVRSKRNEIYVFFFAEFQLWWHSKC